MPFITNAMVAPTAAWQEHRQNRERRSGPGAIVSEGKGAAFGTLACASTGGVALGSAFPCSMAGRQAGRTRAWRCPGSQVAIIHRLRVPDSVAYRRNEQSDRRNYDQQP